MGRMLAESVKSRARRRRGLGVLTVLAAAVGLVVLASTSSCGRHSAAGLVFRGAPVVLISVDTLRADHLPAYGYRAVETPALDALRKDSVLFQNAYSHVPLTLPSHTSVFTGLLPPQTGVRDNLGYALGDGPPTIASFLKAQGYATGGAVSAIVLSHATGVSRGFDFYEDNVEPTRLSQSIARVQRDGDETAGTLEDWIGPRADQPFFAFLHLFEPHTPYEPPEPFASKYASAPYDGEIARADQIVGRFVKYLKDQDIYDRALVIFMSDHGEGLNDHGEDEHGVLLYREAIHVPLFVKYPKERRAGETVSVPVALTDIFPTVSEVVGRTPPPGLAGRSLTAVGADGAARRIYGETLYPRLHLGWSDLASLVDGTHQYIESPRPELYDLAADPGEKNDLSAGLPPAFRSMRAELERMPRPLQPPGASDPEQVKKLAALGYVGGSSADFTSKDLPAPRERIGAVEQLKAGFGAFQRGSYEKAVEVLGNLLKTEPGMTDVWQMYGDALMKLGREKEALAAFQTAAKLSPGNPQILMALADYFTAIGDFDQARKHAELLGESGTASPHENLARIALAEGDLPTAEKEARKALERYPSRRIPRMIIGRVLHDRRDCPNALAMLDEAARPYPGRTESVRLQNLQYLRGDCLARMGRSAEAEAAFQDEIRTFPASPAPRAALAMLYASEGREGEARRSLTDLMRLGTPEAYFTASQTYDILGDAITAAQIRTEARRLFPAARERRAAG